MSEYLDPISVETAEFWAANGAQFERKRIIALLEKCECDAVNPDECLCEYRPITRASAVWLIKGEQE